MKHISFKFSFLAVFFVTVLCAGSEITKSFNLHYEKNQFRVKKSGNYYKGSETVDILSDSKKFIKNYKPGYPALPVEMIKLAVPNGAQFIGVEINFDEKLFTDFLPEPSQPHVALIEGAKKPERVEPLEEIYDSKAGSFPENIVEYKGTQEINRYTVFSFNVSPFLYKDNRTLLAENINIKVKYTIKPKVSARKHDNGKFYNILKHTVINPSNLEIPVISKDAEDVQYLIITTEELENSFEPLREWKTEKGVKAETITIEKIRTDYAGASDKEKIRACVKDYHENRKTMWVLLGGDPDLIADFNAEGRAFDYLELDKTIPFDIGFACIDGDGEYTGEFEDITQDLFIGRASVIRVEEAEAFVEKTVNYEKNPALEEFANNMLLTGANLFGDPLDNPSDAQVKNRKMWNEYLNPDWNSGVKFEFHDTYSDFNNDLTNDNLEEVINNGYSFIHMSTHGNQLSWKMEDNSGYSYENVASQTNLNKQGIITSIACIINAVDTDGTYMHDGEEMVFDKDPCLTESYLRNPNGGAVACVANTRVGLGVIGSGFGLSFKLINGFYENIFSFDDYNIGSALAASKLEYSQTDGFEYPFMGESLRWAHYVLDLAGDPELNVLTDNPTEMVDVQYPDSIPLNEDVEIIFITWARDALVCMSNGSDLYEYGRADMNGIYRTTVNTSSEDPIKVVITAHNKIPHFGSINSSDVGISDNTPYSTKLHQNYPNPFNPETVINYEISKNSKVNLQVYNVKGELVKHLVNRDMKAGIHSAKFNGAEFTSGVYYYMLKADNKTIA